MKPNCICCIGNDQAGRARCYVIAYRCPEVRIIILDSQDDKKNTSNNDSEYFPIPEFELEKMILKCRNKNLFFSSDYSRAIKEADLIILCFKIPFFTLLARETKKYNFKKLEDVAKLIGLYSESDKIIVEKIHLAVPAFEKISSVLESFRHKGVRYRILSNPEFINETTTIEDLLNPEFVIIGCHDKPMGRTAAKSLSELYESWIPQNKILIFNYRSCEIHKLAVNAFVAQKLCTLNSLAIICEETGADISELISILSRDSRLGLNDLKFLLETKKYEKYVSNLIAVCNNLNLLEVGQYWEAVLNLNEYHMQRFIEKIKTILAPLENNTVTVLGFSSGKNGCSTKYSPALKVCEILLNEKCKIKIYDPNVKGQVILNELKLTDVNEKERNVEIFSEVYLACNASSGIIICNDNEDFINLNYIEFKKWMKRPVIIDGKKCLNGKVLREAGIEYHTVGLSSKAFNNSDPVV